MTITIQRDVLHQAIDKLPEGTLIELAKFIEFLQFKVQRDEQIGDVWELPEDDNIAWQSETEETPPFNPVHFPDGILKGVDFSPEYIAEARKELWAGFGENFE
jgi:hypothetical protein